MQLCDSVIDIMTKKNNVFVKNTVSCYRVIRLGSISCFYAL